MPLRRALGTLGAVVGLAVCAAPSAAAAAYPPGPPEDETPPTPGVVCGQQPGDVTTVVIGSGEPARTITVKPGEFLTLDIEGAATGQTVVLDPPNGDPVTLTVQPNATKKLAVGPCSYNDLGDYLVEVGGKPVTVRVLGTSAAASGLASTGGSYLGEAIGAGAALVVVGGGLVVLTARRRQGTKPAA